MAVDDSINIRAFIRNKLSFSKLMAGLGIFTPFCIVFYIVATKTPIFITPVPDGFLFTLSAIYCSQILSPRIRLLSYFRRFLS